MGITSLQIRIMSGWAETEEHLYEESETQLSGKF